MSMCWPIAKEAITDFLGTNKFPTTLTMVDLGCSCGPNTLMFVSNLIKQVEHNTRQERPLEYQIFFNDLCENDFNTIFTSLPSFLQRLNTQTGADFGQCFFNAVPGSFYGRLFPTNSVHFFHSSNSLRWLSQAPQGIENNKGNIFMSRTSPRSVLEAYSRQFRKDFSMFLRCRAEELITGGCMVLTILGRTSEDRSNKECNYVWEFLNSALNSMVVEGIVEEEKVNSFNIPSYMPSLLELKVEVLTEGSFTINRLEVSRIDWNFYDSTQTNPSSMFVNSGYDFVKCVRSIVESLLIHHFGEAIMDELFYRYRKIVADHMSKEKIESLSLTISLTKING